MESWSVHQLFDKATSTLGREQALSLQAYAQQLISNGYPVIFTLNHLARITNLDYRFLRQTVGRKREAANYRVSWIKKRAGGFRAIHSVSHKLNALQSYINTDILQAAPRHPNSFAFHNKVGIRMCARNHCGARWIIKMDLKDFFYSITEVEVYRAFRMMGYCNLLSFELSRLCTTVRMPESLKIHLKNGKCKRLQSIPYKPFEVRGVLPQGAPTSPMLSNIVARDLDVKLAAFSLAQGFIYTRYADDLTFSSNCILDRRAIGQACSEINYFINSCGFVEHKEKRHIAGPGSRKIVLGLLVDGTEPRLSKANYRRIEHHFYSLGKFGLTAAASNAKFSSAWGYLNYLSGLYAYIKDVDPKRGEEFSSISDLLKRELSLARQED